MGRRIAASPASGNVVGTPPPGRARLRDIDSATIAGNTAVITGTMVSIVNLRSPKGTAVTFSETVSFVTTGVDNGTPGAGKDTFSLSVVYAPGGGQAMFFGGTHVTFAGTVVTGDIVVR